MRILVVTNLYHPDRGGGGSVFTDLFDGLAERGHEITVQTAYPYYPEWIDKSGENGRKVKHEQRESIAVHRYGMFIPSRPSSMYHRALQELSFFMSLSRGIIRHSRVDVVVVFCPMISSVAYAGLRRVIRHEPTIINVQDIPADAAGAGDIVSGRALTQLAAVIQRLLFRRAQVWTSIAPSMVERVAQVSGKPERVFLLPNHLNRTMSTLIEESTPRRATVLEDGAVPRLLYAGNIGGKQNLLDFCKLASGLDQAFALRVFGSGSQAKAVQEWIEHSSDSRFEFGPFLSEAAFVDEMVSHDVFVITETPDAGASFIPSKLIPAIAAGIPILAVADRRSPLSVEVSTYGLGLAVEWDRVEHGITSMTQLLRDPLLRASLDASLARRAEAYSRESAVDRLESVLNSAISSRSR